MLTEQDIKEVVFTKSLGGYKTSEVDAFLDQCAETVAALTTTNEENTRKLQVLAESVVEYRNQEDSIRTTLMNAQRMADTVVKEAQEKADAAIAEAQKKAEEILAEAQNSADNARELADQSIVREREELARVRKEGAAFKARLMAAYREHLTLIGVLEGGTEEEPAPAAQPEQPQPETETPEAPVAAPVVPAEEAEKVAPFDISSFELRDEE